MSQQPTTTPAPHPNGSPLNINRKTKMQAQVQPPAIITIGGNRDIAQMGLKTLISAADAHLSRRRGPHFLPPLVHGSTLLVGNGKSLLVHGGPGWLRLSTRGGGHCPVHQGALISVRTGMRIPHACQTAKQGDRRTCNAWHMHARTHTTARTCEAGGCFIGTRAFLPSLLRRLFAGAPPLLATMVPSAAASAAPYPARDPAA